MKFAPLAISVGLTVASPSMAQTSIEDSLQLDDHVITGSRFAQQSASVTNAHTVFTRSDIEGLQARSVQDLLTRVPGVQVRMSGGIPTYNLRGTNSNQTLVLVDGQRLAGANDGIARIDFLNIDNIERVEVIRGPRASVYGADALGGVIQIFTRQGEAGLHPEVRLAAGTDDTFERQALLRGGNEATRFSLGASLNESAAVNYTTDGVGRDRDDDLQRSKGLFLRVDHRFDERIKAGLNINDQRGVQHYDDAYDLPPGNPRNQFRQSAYSAYLEAAVTDRLSSRLEAGRSSTRIKAIGAAQPWNRNSNETERDSLSWLNLFRLSDNQSLTLAADWYEDQLESDQSYTETSRHNRGLFAQYQTRIDQFGIELGLRHDDNEHFGSENSGNLALSWFQSPASQWTLSYAQAYRAPTFNDLYHLGWGGNPELQPETARAAELQWRGQVADTELQLSVYRNDIDDMIAADSTWTLQNVDQVRIHGFEASAQQHWGNLSGAVNLSLLDPRDRGTGKTLSHRAKRQLSTDLDYRRGDVSVGATWRVLSQRYADANNDTTLAGYGTIDLRSSWSISPELRLELQLTNLLDREYHTGAYQRSWPTNEFYGEMGRQALLAVSWTPQL